MDNDEKKIRNDWKKFRSTQKRNLSDREKRLKVEEFHQIIKSMFGGDMK